MSATYITIDGDTADLIVWRVFQSTAGVTEQLFESNPGLADRGPVLAAGLMLTLPTPPAPAVAEPLRLWD